MQQKIVKLSNVSAMWDAEKGLWAPPNKITIVGEGLQALPKFRKGLKPLPYITFCPICNWWGMWGKCCCIFAILCYIFP